MNALLVVVAILGVSASGPLMAGASAPALAIAFWRNALGTVAIAPVVAPRARRELATLGRDGWRLTVFAAVMLALHFGTWVTALKMTSVAAATAMVSMQVVFVVVIDHLRGERATRVVVAGIALAIAGVLVITGVDFSLRPRAMIGDLLALVGGLTAALYMIAGSQVRERVSTGAYTVACYGICAATLLLACVVAQVEMVDFSGRTWLAIIGVTICAQLLGHSVLNHLLAVMSPGLISLLLLLEVPGAAILAGIFLDQVPPVGVYVGLGLILAGLVVVVARRPPPAPALAD
ncbi:DMT family transporter [Aeromicrobium fastidiosum]|uniref:DMT family transporter n=1 Tax=Aeromicrobium fastidiosum TaxID=52699 RepID=A0A641AKE5_9ACTN|nr:DMT family transporter [Aeromicrobium fastidiosum]KAA1373019.1 DMT family transporter [Aeromicrobium fastidiosum]MBP2390993.1 drug/metabolite transporter (DMT)-like permease [Aeromicrobium fastidiosum]